MGVVKYTGPVASFHCPTNAEIRSLKVHFSPKQEGTGDPSPENVRPIVGWDGVEVEKKGKNLYKVQHRTSAKANYTETNSGLIVSSTSDGTYCASHFKLLSITSKNIGQTFTFSAKCISATQAQRILLAIKNSDNSNFRTIFEKTSNYVYTFTVPNDFPEDGYCQISYYCTGAVSTSGTTEYSEIQLELGSKATSYEPYHDEIVDYEFGVLGKNKLDPNLCQLQSYWNSNQGRGFVSDWISIDYISVLPNTTYTITGSLVTSESPTARHLFYNKNKELISSIPAGTSNQTFTTPNECKYVRLSIKNTSLDNLQLELGSTATSYEPYDPKNTVYGGWVDLISGEVCEEWKIIDLGNCTWIHYKNRDSVFYTRTLSNLKVQSAPDTVMSTHYKYEGAPNVTAMNELTISDSQQLNKGNVNICDPNYSEYTVEQFKEAMSGVMCAYKAVNTSTYHLAPTELQTFLGQNNVWSNADYVEVEYDLHETQEILNRKAFIMANQPHLIAPEAAQLQSFTTDLAAPLKECKAYFKPKQSGEGDPSPENIRPIEGWDELEVWRTGKNLAIKPSKFYRGYGSKAYNNVDENLVETDTGFKCTPKNGSSGYSTLIAYVHKGQTYTLSFTKTGYCGRWSYSITNKSDVGTETGESTTNFRLFDSGWFYSWNTPIQITPTVDGYLYLGCHQNSSTPTEYECSNIQLELGDTATEYEPYNGTTIPITFPTEAGTIYGGYVDLVSGMLVMDKKFIKLNGTENWLSNSAVLNGYYYTAGDSKSTSFYLMSDKYTSTQVSGGQMVAGQMKKASTNINFCTSFDSLQAWKNELAANNVELVYELFTPITYQLTPQEIRTLRGQNNIWSSANDKIEIKYWKH